MKTQLIKGQYQLIQKLSEGGFGITYLAEDRHRPSGRRCVLKQLKPVSTNIEQRQLIQERFRQEAIILENLGDRHCQIPELYSYFEDEGLFYIAQEWIEGQTLSQLGQAKAMDERGVLALLRQILPVLDYIHGDGIIHRDLKPANIICRESSALPVLIDFGAVKEVMGTHYNSQGHPKSSIMIGTPGYCPPEQAAGYPTYASDLYSLGMTMIVMLTQKSPVQLNADPTQINTDWHQYIPYVSQTLKQVLDRSIQFNPHDRYATAQMMLEDLPAESLSRFSTGFRKVYEQTAAEVSTEHQAEQPDIPRQVLKSIRLSQPLPVILGVGISALAVGGFLAFRSVAPKPSISEINSPFQPAPSVNSPDFEESGPPVVDTEPESPPEPERDSKSAPSQSEAKQIVGFWVTEEVSFNSLPIKFIAEYYPDGSHKTVTFYGNPNDEGFYKLDMISDTQGTWRYANGILTEQLNTGGVIESSIRWIDEGTVEVKILKHTLPGFVGTNFRAWKRPGKI